MRLPTCGWETHGHQGRRCSSRLEAGSQDRAVEACTSSFGRLACLPPSLTLATLIFFRLKNILETWKAKRSCSVHKRSNHRRRLPCPPESRRTRTLPASSPEALGASAEAGRGREGILYFLLAPVTRGSAFPNLRLEQTKHPTKRTRE